MMTCLDAGYCEVRDLESDSDGRFALKILVFDGWKTEMGSHQVFLATLEIEIAT